VIGAKWQAPLRWYAENEDLHTAPDVRAETCRASGYVKPYSSRYRIAEVSKIISRMLCAPTDESLVKDNGGPSSSLESEMSLRRSKGAS
jgi:hypothetical protein